MSATTYSALGGPGSIISTPRQWYPVGEDWQRKSSIINFDFVTRESAAFIRHCIESNIGKPLRPRLAILRPSEGEIVRGPRLTVAGVGTPGARVTFSGENENGNPYGTGVVSNEGTWEISVVTPPQVYELSCWQLLNGHGSHWTSPITIQYVGPMLSPEIRSPANGSMVGNRRPDISGRGAVPGASVEFYDTKEPPAYYGSTLADSIGSWFGTLGVDLPGQEFSLRCLQRLAGVASPFSEPVTFTLMNAPTILAPSDGSEGVSVTTLIRGEGALPGATVWFFKSGDSLLDYGRAVADENGQWSGFNSKPFPLGQFSLACKQTLNGVGSEPASVTFNVGILAPRILTPIDGSTVDTVRPWISGEGTPGATILFYKSGTSAPLFGHTTVGASGEWGSAPSIDLPGAEFSLSCTQLLNNVYSPPSSPITFNIQDPVPVILTPADGSEVDSINPVISGEGGRPGAVVHFYEQGSFNYHGQANVGESGTWRAMATTGLPPGRFTLVCNQTFGEWQSRYSAPSTFTVLDKPPAPTDLSVTPDKTSAYVEWQNSSPNVIYFLYSYSAGGEQSIFSNKVTLNNLESDREYTFRVRSMSRDFKLSEYASITFKTSGDGGSEPTNFRVTHNANRNVSFAWDLPVEGASNVIGYVFKVFVVGTETSLGTTRVFTMNNMVPLVPAVVGVKCKFMNGTDSDWSQLTVVPSL